MLHCHKSHFAKLPTLRARLRAVVYATSLLPTCFSQIHADTLCLLLKQSLRIIEASLLPFWVSGRVVSPQTIRNR